MVETLNEEDFGLIGLDKYPEFRPLVNDLARMVIDKINTEAPKIESDAIYKAQGVLEWLIDRLQDAV